MTTQIFYIIIWLATIEIIGLAALPLTNWLFRALPDRGYAFSKPLGLLLISYTLWLLGSFQIIHNTRVTIILLLLALAAVSWIKFRSLETIHIPRRVIWATEIIFLLAFAYLVVLKMYDPGINHTEKPMDFGFLNATLRSDTFPPHDPWLSGFGISYYYFGYVLIAVLTKLSGVPASISFNLAVSLLFALTMSCAFSIVYNLVKSHKPDAEPVGAQRAASISAPITYGIIGAILVGFIGNIEGLFELLHDRGIGSPAFWNWLDIKDLAQQSMNAGWPQPGSWWWWRASRVIKDVTFGNVAEVIDEFPFFSFMLGDMHPHVMGLPFSLLAIALALNLLLSADENLLYFTPRRFRNPHYILRFALYALALGALGFLNTWDFPIYLFIVGMVYAVRRYKHHGGIDRAFLIDIITWGAGVLILGIILYLPFYIGFRSQAGGLLPNAFTPTRLHQFLVYIGIQFFAVLSLLILLSTRIKGAVKTTLGILPVTILTPIVVLLSALVVVFTTRRELVDRFLQHYPQAPFGNGDLISVLKAVATIRVTNPWTYLLLALLISWSIALLWRIIRLPSTGYRLPSADSFTLILILTASLLFFGPEFVYLRDNFATRMNTIFKFYYQAWTMMGIAAAYAAYRLSRLRGTALRIIWQTAFVVLIAAGLIYPFASTYSKAGGFRGQPTLDGSAFIREQRPDDYAAIQWLRENSQDNDVILEANGDSYRVWHSYVSVHTGLSTLLGWGGHESQWRGNYVEPGKREPVIKTIYTSSNVQEVRALLDEYNIKYIYVGPTEREKFGNLAGKNLARFLEVAFQQGNVTIYRHQLD